MPPREKCHEPPSFDIVPLQKMARFPSGETRGKKTPSALSKVSREPTAMSSLRGELPP